MFKKGMLDSFNENIEIRQLKAENEKLKEQLTLLEDWKELFFLLKKDHELIENLQTGEWIEKAGEMGIDV